MQKVKEGKTSPRDFWEVWGPRAGAESLAWMALRVLGQVCSSSAAERIWSNHGFVHDQARNRLAPSRAEKLVYVYRTAWVSSGKGREEEFDVLQKVP